MVVAPATVVGEPGTVTAAGWLPTVVVTVAADRVVVEGADPLPVPPDSGAELAPEDPPATDPPAMDPFAINPFDSTSPPVALVADWALSLLADAQAGGLAAMAATAPKNNEPLKPPASARDAAAA